MAPLALVANLTTRWQNLDWFKKWPGGTICIVCKAGHKVASVKSGPKDRTPGLPGSDENTWTNILTRPFPLEGRVYTLKFCPYVITSIFPIWDLLIRRRYNCNIGKYMSMSPAQENMKNSFQTKSAQKCSFCLTSVRKTSILWMSNTSDFCPCCF